MTGAVSEPLNLPSTVCSPFAPISPDGPLPPGLDARTVSGVFHSLGVPPKKVLGLFGVHRYVGTAAARLRRVLDDPDARMRCFEHNDRPLGPFHARLYFHLLEQDFAQSVYRRVVQPAETEDHSEGFKRVFLDPVRFGQNVARDLADRVNQQGSIEAFSEEEALCLFALAFALLQPTDAQAIVAPLAAAGPLFARFFGIAGGESAAAQELAEAECGQQSAGAEAPERSQEAVPSGSIEREPPSGESVSAVVPTEPNKPVLEAAFRAQPPKVGPRAARLSQIESELTLCRVRRQEIGSAASLDLVAFARAHQREVAEAQARADFGESVSREIRQVVDRIVEAGRLVGANPDLGVPDSIEATVMWLDDNEAVAGEVAALADDLKRKQQQAAERGVQPRRTAVPGKSVVALDELRRQLAETLDETERAIRAFMDWQGTAARLRADLADCSAATRATSLRRLDQRSALALLSQAVLDPTWEGLRAPLFRLWAERWGWSSPDGLSAKGLLKEALAEASRAGDPDGVAEPLALLTRGMIQDLLAIEDPVLSRHVALAVFWDSLAHRSEVFFVGFWAYEAAWPSRPETLGPLAYRFLSALYRVFLKLGSAGAACQVLASLEGVGALGVEARPVLAFKKQTLALDERLRSTGGVQGLFAQLRRVVSVTHFRPLARLVREQRVEDVESAADTLRRLCDSGELYEAAVSSLEDRRNLRPAHRESLERYVRNDLAAVREWIDLYKRLIGQSDQLAGDEDLLELQQTARRLIALSEDGRDMTIGSIDWLGGMLGRAVLTAAGDHAGAPPIWLTDTGVLWPELAEMVDGDKGTQRAGRRGPAPFQLRSWVASCKADLQWWDILQDLLAVKLLGQRRTAEQVADALTSASEFDALLATEEWPAFAVPELRPAMDRARALAQWKRDTEAELDSLDKRLTGLRLLTLPNGLSQLVELERVRLVDGFGCVERLETEGAERLVASVTETVERVELQIRAGEAHGKALRGWLAAASIEVAPGTPVSILEQLVAQTESQAALRRRHIEVLRRLDTPAAPPAVREAVRRSLAHAEWPGNWPSAPVSEIAALYLDNIASVVGSLWSAAAQMDSDDAPYRRIAEISDCLAASLESEVLTLCSGRPEEARLASIFAERGTWTVRDLHARLLPAQPPAPEAAPPGVPSPVPTAARDTSPQGAGPEAPALDADTGQPDSAETLVGSILSGATGTGTSQSVERAYEAFDRQDYASATKAAEEGWRWLRSQSPDRARPLLALWAWSAREQGALPHGLTPAEALGLLFRHWQLLSSRAPSAAKRAVAWLLDVVDAQSAASESSGSTAVARMLAELADLVPGSEPRDRFGSLLRHGDGPVVAGLLWEAVRGHAEAAKARAALLLLLFDFGEDAALNHLFALAGDQKRYLTAFASLARRARVEPSPQLVGAIQQNMHRIIELKDRPYRDFAQRVAARLKYATGRVMLSVPAELDSDPATGAFRLAVSVEPDEGDPPILLRVTLEPSEDCQVLAGSPRTHEVITEDVMLDRREIDFFVVPRLAAGGATVSISVHGETASGQVIDRVERREVTFGGEVSVAPIGDEELLEIYAGYDAKPVSGPAFVGREEELKVLETAIIKQDGGAVLLYGVRRLGKTSILDEFRRRHCAAFRKGSHVLFVSVPVDQLSLTDGRPFLDQFLRHVNHSVTKVQKNERLRDFFAAGGVGLEELERAAQIDSGLASASFLVRLREYLGRLQTLAGSRISRFVLLFDEFDKLLECYRRGWEAEVEELTNNLRHAATEERGLGIVLAGSELMARIVGHYRNALFGSAQDLHLRCFSGPEHRQDAVQIISPERLGGRRVFTEQAIEQVIRISGGHPLYMRLVACASARLVPRRRITAQVVSGAVNSLLRNRVLPGRFPDPPRLVRQPLQVLQLIDQKEEMYGHALAEMLLFVLARHSSLERLGVNWAVVAHEDRLLNCRPADTWIRLRNQLQDVRLIFRDHEGLWQFTFPILAEQLRLTFDYEFERLAALVESDLQSGPGQ